MRLEVIQKVLRDDTDEKNGTSRPGTRWFGATSPVYLSKMAVGSTCSRVQIAHMEYLRDVCKLYPLELGEKNKRGRGKSEIWGKARMLDVVADSDV